MLLAALVDAIRALGLEGRRLLVAVSGGVDSCALLEALHEVSGEHGLGLAVGHVHHGLRGEEADADARAVRALAEKRGLPFFVARVDPGRLREGRSNRERPTLQEAARQLRYEALHRMADEWGADHVVTAHQLDDQAETVLMRLLRGTGPDGLGGIPERSPDGRVVRPLLAVPRSEIERFARERGLSWRDDASNRSDAYLRNRIRRHWLPALTREFNPQLLRIVGNLAEAQRRDAEWIARLVDAAAATHLVRRGASSAAAEGARGGVREERRAERAEEEEGREEWIELVGEDWAELPEALARRLVARAMSELGAGRDVTRGHLTRVLDFVRARVAPETGKTLELPGGLRLRRERGGWSLRRAVPPSGPGPGAKR